MTRPYRNLHPSRIANLAWGARQGLILTAIVLVPAGIAATASNTRERTDFLTVAVAYLAFGAVAGLLLGLARPRLGQKFIAITVGALIGGVGMSALMAFADAPGRSRAQLVATGSLLGLGIGSFLGWWAWRRIGNPRVR